jgi:RNA exonuclease 1
MGKNDRKRVYSEFARKGASAGGAAPSPTGVASTLADLRTHQAGSDGWTAVSRSKKNKKGSDTCSESTADRGDRRPDLTYSNLHELQSFVKIADLQSLVLYCLAHGVGPRWISVKRHEHINKAVVIMVPGLEEGMFNGCIDLESRDAVPEQVTEEAGQDAVNPKAGEQNRDACRSTTDRSPDDYMPVILDGSKLSSSLKPLASIFKHLWPVKAPGDDRYFKVHSPLHAMLTCPIPKNQEEKWAERHTRGPIPVRDAPEWKDERTPITALLASREDLEENEYVLHPVYFTDEKGTDEQLARRAAAKATKDFGWIDSAVGDIEEGVVPDKEVEQGSITAGRTVLAMDCEMCIVEGGETALTRISIVGWDGEVVMDELVKPDKPIVDYLTQYDSFPSLSSSLISLGTLGLQLALLNW